jgi:hypothetical protein
VPLAVPSDRGCPLVTLPNGTLMARRSCADLQRSGPLCALLPPVICLATIPGLSTLTLRGSCERGEV